MIGRLIMVLIFLGLAAAEVVAARDYPQRAQFGPWLVGGVVIALALFQMVREVRQKSRPVLVDEDVVVEDRAISGRSYAIVALWLTGLMLGTYLFGMLITFPLFVLAYVKSHRWGWLLAISMAAVIFGLLYGVFGILLKATLYRGIFFE
ncbi:MAG: tripartite tricarboxylate transporter TctB family protein [Chloroflexi bacterium]|nr:tripartite tricarboxylate transporter TctB family protein [Chloroflexota bacterium]